jgi:hypothetical protein
MENAAQANPTTPQKASRMATILSLGSSILINGAFPVIIYWALKNYTAASDYVALVLTGVPSLIDSIVGIIRRKRIPIFWCDLLVFYRGGAALDPAQALQIELGAAIEGVETILLN